MRTALLACLLLARVSAFDLGLRLRSRVARAQCSRHLPERARVSVHAVDAADDAGGARGRPDIEECLRPSALADISAYGAYDDDSAQYDPTAANSPTATLAKDDKDQSIEEILRQLESIQQVRTRHTRTRSGVGRGRGARGHAAATSVRCARAGFGAEPRALRLPHAPCSSPQGNPKKIVILGTRHCSFLHQQIIELLSYALVLSGNHVYTSGAIGTHTAVIRGALRAENQVRERSPCGGTAPAGAHGVGRAPCSARTPGPTRPRAPRPPARPPARPSQELLTVILPQTIDRQPQETRTLLESVEQVLELGHNELPLGYASRLCNSELLAMVRAQASALAHPLAAVCAGRAACTRSPRTPVRSRRAPAPRHRRRRAAPRVRACRRSS